MSAGVVAAVVDDGALDGEDADDVAGGGPENGADPETGVTGCYKLVISAFVEVSNTAVVQT